MYQSDEGTNRTLLSYLDILSGAIAAIIVLFVVFVNIGSQKVVQTTSKDYILLEATLLNPSDIIQIAVLPPGDTEPTRLSFSCFQENGKTKPSCKNKLKINMLNSIGQLKGKADQRIKVQHIMYLTVWSPISGCWRFLPEFISSPKQLKKLEKTEMTKVGLRLSSHQTSVFIPDDLRNKDIKFNTPAKFNNTGCSNYGEIFIDEDYS